MMISLNAFNKNTLVPKEISTASLGVVISATSNVAIQIFDCACIKLPTIIVDFITYGCGATSVAGTVMAVYASIHLCQKIISKENELHKAISATALGILFTSSAQAIGEYFWRIAPCFHWLDGSSMAFYIGTNFAWQACLIMGIASIAFTAFAAYRVGQAALSSAN